MNNYRIGGYRMLPPVVKNLIIINVLMYLITIFFQHKMGIDLSEKLGLFFFESPSFRPYQIITHMFMHGSWSHLLFNMFALWMFGMAVENKWGGKRFFIFYFVSGLGAAAFYSFIQWIQFSSVANAMPPDQIQYVMENGKNILMSGRNFSDPAFSKINLLLNVPIIGASGAIFGVLLAFGMLFPNMMVYIYFLIPMKAKWFVALYGGMELVFGVMNEPGDNIAHFAHLGGMIFGFLLILLWKKRDNNQFMS